MQITDKTKLNDIAEFISCIPETDQEAVITKSKELYEEYDNLYLDRWLELLDSLKTQNWIDPEMPAMKYFWYIGFIKWMKNITDVLDNLTIKQTQEEYAANSSCFPCTFQETVLTFTRSFFNLTSYEECSNIKVWEFLLARKETYNKIAYQKALSEKLTAKYKK